MALGALVGLWGLLGQLRAELGLPEPTPAAAGVDVLRGSVECPQEPGREGEGRVEAMTQPALAIDVTSDELLTCPQTWNGRAVRLFGELVGGVLHRGDRAWLQLNDDPYALELGPLPTHRDHRGIGGGLGVLVATAELAPVTFIGGPDTRGDVVEVVGRFHRVDPVTREVAIVRAETLTVVASGARLQGPAVPLRRTAALIAMACAAIIVMIQRRWPRRP